MARRTPTHLGAISFRFSRDGTIPLSFDVLGCFRHQDDLAGCMYELPPPKLKCKSCGDTTYELLQLSVQMQVCDTCQLAVHEAFTLRHSGAFANNWRDRGPPPEKRRLHRPATTSESMAVYRRDSFTCRYCRVPGGQLTVDHVDPNGDNLIDNFATACQSCNSSKGSRTPEQAGMELLDA